MIEGITVGPRGDVYLAESSGRVVRIGNARASATDLENLEMNETEVFIWTSYSCNNSSDYRLVAEFETPHAAQAMRDQLVKFFTAHAKEYDKQSEADDFDWPGEPTKVARQLGEKHGHKWREFLIWGEEALEGDEPEVGLLGKSIVLYHGYCSGGFGPDIPRVLERAGAKLVEKGAKDGPPVLLGSFDIPERGTLVSSLEALFAQRLTAERSLTDWELPKWLPGDGAGRADDVSFVVEDGRCTFTLPLVADNIEPLRKHLEAGGAKGLELRLASKADVTQNKKREEKQAAAAVTTGAEPKVFLEQTSAVKAAPSGPLAVHTLFDYDPKINGADAILIGDGGVIAFAGDKGQTQRLVTADCKKRAVANLAFPRSWLQGFLVEADGTWRAGGEKARIYLSTDEGKSWKEEKHPGLAAAIDATTRIWSLCRYQGALWAAGSGGVARQVDGKWQKVAVPAEVKAKVPGYYTPNVFLPRLVIANETLYVLGFGVARWDGKKLVTELACGHDVRTLAVTDAGTLIAAGAAKIGKDSRVQLDRTVWRKPRGGTWSNLDEAAIDVGELDEALIQRGISYSETFIEVVCTGGLVVLVGEDERPQSQMNAVRISKDDGKTFKRMEVSVKGQLVTTAAIADGRGGVLVAGQGGVLLRLSRDGIGAWATRKAAKAAAPARPAAPAKVAKAAVPAKAAKAAAPATTAGKPRRFEFVGGGSSKFWEISLDGAELTTRFGRIGSDGQTSTKRYDSPEKAAKEHAKLVNEKTKKGYQER